MNNSVGGSISINLYKGSTNFEVPIHTNEKLTCEDVCTKVSKHLKFCPLSLQLFGLRLRKTELWFPPGYEFEEKQVYQVDFRLRYRLPSLIHLSRIDENAFDYLFHQIRQDLLNEEIQFKSNIDAKPEIIGLCVTDMFRTIIEERVSRNCVENNYRQYIPKSIYKQHSFPLVSFLKNKIRENLNHLLSTGVNERQRNPRFIKESYVSQVEELSPLYLSQEFHATTFKEDEYPVTIRVNPFDPIMPGVSITYIGKQNWEHICTVEELCFITMRKDCTSEISRKNGIPICFKFKSMDVVQSFISILDGYYRLCEKWTFNLCKELSTPSLAKLKMLRCHGPVGEKFAHQKLSTHPNTKNGSYLLRQSSTAFDEYSIDFILVNKNKPISRSIHLTEKERYAVDKYPVEFDTLPELIAYFISKSEPYLDIKECLPPSEYDRSELLICRTIKPIIENKTSSESISMTDKSGGESAGIVPQCISARSLQVFRGKKYEFEGKHCKIIKAIWKKNENTNVDVAIKFLKKESEEKYMKEFLEMADRCVLWKCESLINLRGIVLGNPQALVLDWMPLGRLDHYLKENLLHVQVNELVEAASHISKALWFLEDHGIVHGNIRCRNILVGEHSDQAFICKLADPSITSEFSSNEIHWIPPELFETPSLVKNFGTADIWALGTTLWEIFSNGESPPTPKELTPAGLKMKYSSGWRLAKPTKCPSEIFKIINDCWQHNPEFRKHPQSIVRDIHQYLYQIMESRRGHPYSKLTPSASSEGSHTQINGNFNVSDDATWDTFGSESTNHHHNVSDATVSTFIHSDHTDSTKMTWINETYTPPTQDLIGLSEMYISGSQKSNYSMGSAQGIYVFGKNQVTLGRIIGQGCYGAVYLGNLTRSDGSSEQIAIKMLKEREKLPEKELADFQTEFNILQGLCHPNIVEVKGVVYDPGLLLVMEYLPMGSLIDYFKMCHTKPNLRQLVKFAQDVAEGMEYLGENFIVHRDLAARNILVNNDDQVKISDFGLARVTGNDNCYTFRTDRKLPIRWYPPESIQYGKFSEQSDVWSYGVTLYEIFSYGEDPNLPGILIEDDVDEIRNALIKGIRLACPETCPKIIYSLLMLPCWNLNPEKRPNFSIILGEIKDVESQLFNNCLA